jgi:hypothetical protein
MGTMSDRICQISLIFGEIEGHYPLKFGNGWLAELEFLALVWTQYEMNYSQLDKANRHWMKSGFVSPESKTLLSRVLQLCFWPFPFREGRATCQAAGSSLPPRQVAAPLGLPPLPGQGGREEEGGRKGRGGKWGEGGPGIPPCPSLSKASPAPSLGRATKFWG